MHLTEEELVDRAVANLGVQHTFEKDGRAIRIAVLVRVADWRPLVAPWWRGKEACIIAADWKGTSFCGTATDPYGTGSIARRKTSSSPRASVNS